MLNLLNAIDGSLYSDSSTYPSLLTVSSNSGVGAHLIISAAEVGFWDDVAIAIDVASRGQFNSGNVRSHLLLDLGPVKSVEVEEAVVG